MSSVVGMNAVCTIDRFHLTVFVGERGVEVHVHEPVSLAHGPKLLVVVHRVPIDAAALPGNRQKALHEDSGSGKALQKPFQPQYGLLGRAVEKVVGSDHDEELLDPEISHVPVEAAFQAQHGVGVDASVQDDGRAVSVLEVLLDRKSLGDAVPQEDDDRPALVAPVERFVFLDRTSPGGILKDSVDRTMEQPLGHTHRGGPPHDQEVPDIEGQKNEGQDGAGPQDKADRSPRHRSLTAAGQDGPGQIAGEDQGGVPIQVAAVIGKVLPLGRGEPDSAGCFEAPDEGLLIEAAQIVLVGDHQFGRGGTESVDADSPTRPVLDLRNQPGHDGRIHPIVPVPSPADGVAQLRPGRLEAGGQPSVGTVFPFMVGQAAGSQKEKERPIELNGLGAPGEPA